jgi:hypothetical protein
MKLREDLAEFLGTPFQKGKYPTPSSTPRDIGLIVWDPRLWRKVAELTEAELRDLQGDIKRVLQAFVIEDQKPLEGFTISATYTPFQPLNRKGGLVFINGSIPDCALLLLLDMLKGDTQQIRRCPECQNIFYRHRKQIFCSTQCMNRVMAKRFKAKHSLPKKSKRGMTHGRKR